MRLPVCLPVLLAFVLACALRCGVSYELLNVELRFNKMSTMQALPVNLYLKSDQSRL